MKGSEEVTVGQILTTLVRVLLGIVFIVAAVSKLSDPDTFALSIANYKILTAVPVMALATVLPWVELLCGITLVLGIWVRGSILLTFIMLVVFTGVVVSAMVRGLDISCGCFTQNPSAGKIGWEKLGENAVLLLMTFPILSRSKPGISLARLVGICREWRRRDG